ncbi:MAG: AAA family ATPase [Vulcanimicrobiota bacterium]
MQKRQIIVVEADLEQEIPIVRSTIKMQSLHQLMQANCPGPYGLHPIHLSLLDIIEHAGAQMLEVAKAVSHKIVADRQAAGFAFSSKTEPIDDAFCNLFAAYVASETAAARARTFATEIPDVKGAFTQAWVQQIEEMMPRQLIQVLVGEISAFYDHHRNHPDKERRVKEPEQMAACTFAFFSLLANGVKQIGTDARFERHCRALEQMQVDVCGRHYRGFEYLAAPAEDEEPGELLPIAPDDIVGNKEYIAAGLRLARDVAGFDFERGQNPKKINPVLFGQGSPGCGKTITAHAIGNFFLDYCRERGVAARFLVIRRTDWASSFQNASANQLVNIFKEQVQGFHGVVGVYWPDIDTAFAARSDPGMRSEESNILGASFGIFDGTLIPKNGKWFLICDANYMNMDEATLSRITQDPYKILGPVTPEDFVELMREKKLKEFAELLQLTDEDWFEIGKLCIEYEFSGRNVDSICQKILVEIQDVEPPEEYYRVGFDERKKILRDLAKPMTKARLCELMEGYKRFEKEASAQAEKERFDARVQEIVLNLNAQQAAMQALEGRS